jgi:Nitrile hydratase, alpha chain
MDGRRAIITHETTPVVEDNADVLDRCDANADIPIGSYRRELCSCTAFTIIGLPPGWYKDFEYRSRVVRQSRTVLREMGVDLPREIDIRVWDTTADTRYVVLPVQPPETMGWPEEKLAGIVTKEAMIGVARLELPYRKAQEADDGRHA